MSNSEKILFVDDDPLVLKGIVRQLRKSYQVETTTSGIEALEMLSREGHYAVVVSDLRMPAMDGITLLKEVRKKHPFITRVILTGNADLSTAIEAVNSGQVFRFLTKPCSTNALATILALGVRQYQLLTGEQELLNRTLKGSITLLTELLSLANPRAFSRGHRIRNIVTEIAIKMEVQPLWRIEVAALISQIGCMAIPDDILRKMALESPMSESEKKMFANHPEIGSRLVGRIPRLEGVAAIIRDQLKPFDDDLPATMPGETRQAASILKAALDYDHLVSQGIAHQEAVSTLYGRTGMYNPDVLKQLSVIRLRLAKRKTIATVLFDELVPGMVAAEDILASSGAKVIAKGQEITWPALLGLQNFINHIGIREPIKVWEQQSS